MTYHTVSRKNDSQIWNNPFRYAEISEILDDPTSAAQFFADLLIHRNTEFSALIHLYTLACRNLDLNRVNLTNRQVQAVAYAHEGVKKGIHPTRYVATQLKISPRAVQRLLKRATSRMEENMFASEAEVHISNNKQIRWYPTKAAISQQIAKTPRECAACSKSIQGRFTLCYECGKRFGFTREEWQTSKRKGEPAPAKWLLPEARRIDAQVRKEAINELFKAHGFSGQDFEEALELIAS